MNLELEIFTGTDPAEVQIAVNAWLAREKVSDIDISAFAQSVGPDGKIVISILRKTHVKSGCRS